MKTFVRRESLVAFFGLALILGVAFSVNRLLVTEDNRPSPWDYATYLSSSIEIYDGITNGSLPQLVSALSNPFRPPLVALSAVPFYVIFGTSYQSAMLANLLYLVILVVCTYKLTKMFQSTEIALAAAGIIWAISGVMAFDRVFGLDFPTTALVSAGLYLTAASEGFKSRKSCVALGVVIGLGVLTKWSYFVFVTPMIATELIQRRHIVSIRNMVLTGMVAVTISSSWYVNALRQGLIQALTHYAWGAAAKPYAPSSSLFDSTALLYYPRVTYAYLLEPLFGIGLLLIFCLALSQVVVKLLRVRKLKLVDASASSNGRLYKSLALSFLAPLLVFTLLEDKSERFLLPAIPCLVVLLVGVCSGTRIRGFRVGAFLLTAAVLMGSTLSVVGALQPVLGARFGIYEPRTVSDNYFDYNVYSPPKSYDWKVEDVLTSIAASNPQAFVGILANHWVYNQDTLHYYAVRMGFENLRVRDFRDLQVYAPYDNLTIYDVVLVKTENLGENWDTNFVGNILESLTNIEDRFYVEHKMIQSYDLPDGSQLLLFVKNIN